MQFVYVLDSQVILNVNRTVTNAFIYFRCCNINIFWTQINICIVTYLHDIYITSYSASCQGNIFISKCISSLFQGIFHLYLYDKGVCQDICLLIIIYLFMIIFMSRYMSANYHLFMIIFMSIYLSATSFKTFLR